ncbi:MAG: mechanosensitive ion channel family protein [Elusimicrobiota bacterium]
MWKNILTVFNNYLKQSLQYLPKIIVFFLTLVVLSIIVKLLLGRVEKYFIEKAKSRGKLKREREKRVETVIAILNKVVYLIIWLVGLTLLLGELGINLGPILTAAGVLGLALSFGAQSLVKDLISGFFILIEDQIRIGDVAVINGTGGLVVEINLRTTVLRDLAGKVHIFPNGSINSLSNLTKEFSCYIFEIGVAYKEKIDKVIKVIKEVGEELREDEEFGEKIDDFEVFGLDKLDSSAQVIKGKITTKPLEQWSTGREFLRRIKKTFDRKNIEIPFPHRTYYFGEDSPPFEILLNKEDSNKEDAT